MIFVTVGAGPWSFERLIKEMDRIANEIEEEVIMQIGSTNYTPINAKYYDFLPKQDILKLYECARIVVSHAGVGSLISALRYNKPLILVPRMKRYLEVFDDHQLEIAEELEKEGCILAVYDVNALDRALKDVDKICKTYRSEDTLSKALVQYLENIAHGVD